MQDHCHCLAGFCAQHDFRTADIDIVGCSIRCELALDELSQRYPVPSTGTQQLVRCRHRANAPVESRYEIGHRSISAGGLRNNRTDGRECVLDTMVELRDEHALVFLCELALGDIEIIAEHAGGLSRRLIINGTSHGQDPSNLPVWADDAELEIELIVARDGRVPLGFELLDVIGMDSAAEIRVSPYSSRFEAKDGFEFWGPCELTRLQVPVPQADAGLQLSQPKPLFTFSQRI